ncbi:T9SS type A sorting domain-containing protein [Saccharicrinis aurantiacus]|uniref:T9SS type A sorting domain-containing protein n=1 Tax=Saccharicrinis aurantiacus TaxID=1849719 RepID=UPI002491EA05|nr:T9SS type A sorting domain-containing protein [Saccharicrinis aurantiacus]
MLNIQAEEGSQINMVSVTGAKVRSLIASSSVVTIPVSDLAKGIYLIEIINNGTKQVEKVQIN